jgi:hypothetical protein
MHCSKFRVHYSARSHDDDGDGFIFEVSMMMVVARRFGVSVARMGKFSRLQLL